MSKIVNKGAGRAAHAAKTSKHAQRTPLPPRAPRDAMVELRGEVAPKTAKILDQARIDASKSIPKGKVFVEKAEAVGWSADRCWGEGSNDHIQVTATRGAETIFIEWIGGVFQPTATYSHGDRTVRLRNASAALQYAGRTAETAAAETSRVAENRFFRRRETPPEQVQAQREKLPFDPGTALDDEIFAHLAGRRVTWHNRFREQSESAVFPVDWRPPFCHITEFGGERIVNFVDVHGTGYRSFRLSSLLSISRGKSQTIKKTEAIVRRRAAGGGR